MFLHLFLVNPTLAALLREYLNHRERTLAPSAVFTYRRNRALIRALWAERFIASLASM